MNIASARKLWIAAIALFVLWIASLAGMAVVSGSRPPAAAFDPESVPPNTPPAADSTPH